jgi:hypothetical protein
MNTLGKKRNTILTIFLFLTASFFAQTQQEAKNFINISMKGVYKTQKDLMKGKIPATTDADLRKIMKYQFIAVKLYDQKKYDEAVVYSYKARLLVVEVLSATDPIAKEKMKITDEEKTFFDPAKVGEIKMSPKILNASDSKRIEDVDLMDHQAFRKLELGIPIENQQ